MTERSSIERAAFDRAECAFVYMCVVCPSFKDKMPFVIKCFDQNNVIMEFLFEVL